MQERNSLNMNIDMEDPPPTAAAAGETLTTPQDRAEVDDASVLDLEVEEGLSLVSFGNNDYYDEKTAGDDDEEGIDTDMEDQRQLLPDDPPPKAAGETSSTPQDRAEVDDASVLEEGLPLFSFSNDESYDEMSIGDDDEDDIDIIKGLHSGLHSDSDDTSVTQSEVIERTLPEDTFSFLFYSDLYSTCFLCGIMVFLFQISIYVVLANNIINVGNKKNSVGFPINVSIPVRISEVLAIFISIIAQQDVRKAICLYRDGFDKKYLTKKYEGATFWKWTLSIVLRASQGLLGLSITFLLIMRSNSVLDLLLNFSAIEFVTNLDNVVFELASEGLLGQKLDEETTRFKDTKYRVRQSFKNSNKAMVMSLAYFIVLFASFFGGWLYIYKEQRSGEYLCQTIFSQFGDELEPKLGTFTGLFYKHKQKFGDRASYRGTDISDQEKGPLLAYCEEDTRWTLSLTEDGVDADKWDPCNWLAASSESKSFDLLSTTSSPWVINTPTNRAAPLTHHFLMCYECEKLDIPEKNGICKKARKPEKFDQCICKDGYYGLRCEYSEPCQIVEAEGFSKEGGGLFASKYYILEGAETYHRPVYTSLGGNSSEPLSDGTDVVLFNGERWIMSYKFLFPDLKNVTDKKKLARYFSSEFHSLFTDYSVVYESEPVYIAKQLNKYDTASPLRIRWRLSTSNGANIHRLYTGLQKDFIETELSCAVCSEVNPCPKEATCLSNGTCNCPYGYSGSRCEIAPKSLSDGYCDPRYNNITFDFDGGDCCDNTCRSTPENICGKAGQGYIDTGYPPCGRTNQWDLSADAIHGGGQAVALNGNGKILAVADPDLSIVRLFDKDGAEWKQRDQHIQGKPGSNFGASISLSGESINIASNPITSSTVTLGVGAPKIGLVRVFTCSTDGCIQKGEDIFGLMFGSSLSISEDGESIAIGGAATNNEVVVFTWSNDTWEEKGSVAIATPSSRTLSESPHQFRLEGYYVSLSGDYLAVGTLEGQVLPGPRFESAKLITQVFKWENSTGWNPSGNHSRKVELATHAGADLGGFSVDLSEDASILAVGTSVTNPLPTDESIRMYKWDGTQYNALFNGVPSGPAASLSLSSDGKALAVGLPFDSSNGGLTRVYNFYSESPCGNTSEIPLRISFTTDGSPQETSWEVRVDSEVTLRSGSLAGYKYTTFVEEICVKAEACVRFSVFDTEGDGLNFPGVYALMLDGKEIARGSEFGASKYNNVTSCEGEGEPAPTSSPSPTHGLPQALTSSPTKAPATSATSSPTKGPSTPPTFSPKKAPPPEPTIAPIPDPTSSPTNAPTTPPTSSPTKVPTLEPTIAPIPAPTSSPTKSPVTQPPSASPVKQCEGESDLVTIEITLGEKPWSSYWVLTEQDTRIIFDGPYQVNGTIVKEVCKPVNACYKFRLESTDDASALIFLDGKEIGTSATTKNIVEIDESACNQGRR